MDTTKTKDSEGILNVDDNANSILTMQMDTTGSNVGNTPPAAGQENQPMMGGTSRPPPIVSRNSAAAIPSGTDLGIPELNATPMEVSDSKQSTLEVTTQVHVDGVPNLGLPDHSEPIVLTSKMPIVTPLNQPDTNQSTQHISNIGVVNPPSLGGPDVTVPEIVQLCQS
jgi:hypothetical protein